MFVHSSLISSHQAGSPWMDERKGKSFYRFDHVLMFAHDGASCVQYAGIRFQWIMGECHDFEHLV
jgi:hypothetical protein